MVKRIISIVSIVVVLAILTFVSIYFLKNQNEKAAISFAYDFIEKVEKQQATLSYNDLSENAKTDTPYASWLVWVNSIEDSGIKIIKPQSSLSPIDTPLTKIYSKYEILFKTSNDNYLKLLLVKHNNKWKTEYFSVATHD